jgi:hypothetical protein
MSTRFFVSGSVLLTRCSREERAQYTRISIHETDTLSSLGIKCQIPCHSSICLSDSAVRHGPYPLASQLQMTKPQRVANDRD